MFNVIFNYIWASITAHPTSWMFGAAYVFTALINSLPAPGSTGSTKALFYQWTYDFFHVLTHRIVQRFPQVAAPAPDPTPVPKV